eukprot:tig00020629_g12378.t2
MPGAARGRVSSRPALPLAPPPGVRPISLAHAWRMRSASSWTSLAWRRLRPISLAHAWRSSWMSWRRLWPISLAHAWRSASSWTSWRRLWPISLAHAWRSSWTCELER